MPVVKEPAAFEPSGFFALRTPLLAIEELLASWAAADPDTRLAELAARPALRDALFLASPSLVEALERGGVAGASAKVAAYLTRAATRCTPFGLFAGCAVGTLGPRTHLSLGPAGEHRRHTRLDNDYLFALVSALEADPEVRRVLEWRPNTSLYRAGGRLRYAEARLAGTLRSYHLVAVEETDYLASTLERAAGGASVAKLAAGLVDDEVSLDEALEFVGELIASQLLVSDLQVQVTGGDPTDALLQRLGAHHHTSATAAVLERVVTALDKIDATGLGATPDDYHHIAGLLEALPAQVEPARLLQVDLTTSAPGATLGPAVVDELAHALEVLGRLAVPPPSDDPLARFIVEFTERYEAREVALVEALDEEMGIGFAADPRAETAPLLDGLNFPAPADATSAWTGRDAALLDRLTRALQDGHQEQALDEADLAALEVADRPPLPDALAVMATVAGATVDAVDRGQFRLLVRGVDGAPGARLLGRFCYADEVLHQHVRAHLRREEAQRPQALFAEVVHLPDGRLGNILCRPVLRSHEIAFLGRSGAPAECQIPVSDLMVSVRGGRVVLRSRRLDRQVEPRLTTAHNFSLRALGIYRFLCALQAQGTAAGLGWRWGALSSAPFLPRVTCGRLVLARARWTVRGDQLRSLPRDRLPRHVALADGDNELLCDLDSPPSRQVLEHQLRRRTEATFMEAFPTFDELCVTGPEGRFVHEVVVPFVRTGAAVRSRPPAGSSQSIRRRFPPGSEWAYAKLYTGTVTADQVLVEVVRPVVDAALGDGAADSWFFIRYADPHWHLRLRLHASADRVGALVAMIHDAAEPLLADGRIWRVQLDTYEREVERYGGAEGIEPSERLFHHDSEAALAIVETLSGDEALDARWRLALVGIDRLLDDLDLDLGAKLAWAKRVRDGFAKEFRIDGHLSGQLGRRYRSERGPLEGLLAVEEPGDHFLGPGLAQLRLRSSRLAPIAAELRGRGLPVEDLAASYAHMHANRMLRGAHRPQELVIYDLLHRLYAARQHRSQAP